MIITDNFLDKSEFDNINKTFHLSNFPWYFMPFKVHEGDDNYQFYHLFVAKGKVLSKHFEILHPILKKLSVKEIIRIKANLNMKTPERIEYEMHKDVDDCVTAIYYVNSNDGYTRFEDGTKVDSIANRMVVFNSNTLHAGCTPTDTLRRCVINFNYFI